jgi:endonuclease III
MPALLKPASKRSLDIRQALQRIRKAVQPFPKAALFQLASEGFDSVFEQLVACIISVRTFDEVTTPTARRLFEAAPKPENIAKLSIAQIDRMISPCTFHGAKAVQIREIARQTVHHYGGQLPCDLETLLTFRGVGPKCASLVLGIACDQPHISVDIHVHRIVNRWGFVRSSNPEKTQAALLAKLPKRYWIKLNSLLVPFGKHICTGRQPKCSTCPVLDMCQQVGVTSHR